MRLAKTKFLRLWLVALTLSLSTALSQTYGQDVPNPAGNGPNPLGIPMNPGVFTPPADTFGNLEDFATPDTDQNPESPENQALDKAELMTESLVTAQHKWMDDHEGDVPRLLRMWAALFKRAENSDRMRGAEVTNRKISKDDFISKLEGFGQMKLTMCDNKRIVKFNYEKKSEALIIFQKGEISPDSEQLNKIRTGLTIVGNDEKGWDLVTIVEMEESNDTPAEVSHFPKAQFLTGPWWKDNWNFVKSTPTADDWSIGAIMGGFPQTVINGGLSALAMKLHVPGAPATGWFPLAFTFAYATTLGAYNETYWKLTNMGRFQALKQLPNSMFFTAVMLTHAGHMSMSLTFWIIAAATSLVKKPLSSIPWSRSIKLRMSLRENAGKFRFSTYGQEIVTRWNKARVERNLNYLIPFMFVNADIFFRPWMISHGYVYHGFTFPISMVMGAVVARVRHSLYVWSLTRRKVTDDRFNIDGETDDEESSEGGSDVWPQAKADKVQKLWEVEKDYWKRLGAFWNWPTEILNGAISVQKSSVNAYDSVIENAPKVYNAITEHPAMVSTAFKITDTCSLVLENLGLKAENPSRRLLKY